MPEGVRVGVAVAGLNEPEGGLVVGVGAEGLNEPEGGRFGADVAGLRAATLTGAALGVAKLGGGVYALVGE